VFLSLSLPCAALWVPRRPAAISFWRDRWQKGAQNNGGNRELPGGLCAWALGGARCGWQRWGAPRRVAGGDPRVCRDPHGAWGLPNRGGSPRSPSPLPQHSPRAHRAAAILLTGGRHGDAEAAAIGSALVTWRGRQPEDYTSRHAPLRSRAGCGGPGCGGGTPARAGRGALRGLLRDLVPPRPSAALAACPGPRRTPPRPPALGGIRPAAGPSRPLEKGRARG